MRLLSGWVRWLGPASITLLATGCSLSVLDGLTGGSDAGAGGSISDAEPIVDVSQGSDASQDGVLADSMDVAVGTASEGGDAGDVSAPSSDARLDARDTADPDEASALPDAHPDASDAPVDTAADNRTPCTSCPTDGYCFSGECIYRSCKAKLASSPGSPSGVYWLDADGEGDGGIAPFRAYCDMISEGGGYTLALKADGTQPTFLHDAALWENEATYRPEFPDLDTNEAKLASFSSVAFAGVRVGMIQGGVTRWVTIATSASSLRDLMRGSYRSTTLGRDAWKSLSSTGSLQLLCNREGFNISAGAAGVRIGILTNEQDSCNTSDSWLGFGGEIEGVGFSCGNVAHWMADNGEHDLPLFGYILVR